jgi:predicted  nucleic acid-binding Zn-ribbon protein
MQLPIHVMQKAGRSKAITRCPSCGRILWPKDAA